VKARSTLSIVVSSVGLLVNPSILKKALTIISTSAAM
jgi:hypothetical protein